MLGQVTRHLLLMTATPHSGKEEDFQVFLTLLDRDRFEGKQKRSVDLCGVMRRMVKEDLLTFEGRKLFPERIAETVPYELTALEQNLYEDVTHYVREGMNRAEKLGGKRKNTVGFALTVLQRRLASSPEAIYRSLVRRSERLERKKAEILNGTYKDADPGIDLSEIDEDEYNAEEIEEMEEELLDAATAAQTVEELNAELIELADLVETAKKVREAGTDRKWTELSTILQDNALTTDGNGWPRKFIIFTEHRDTLDYLQSKIGSLLGKPDSVKAIHGGVRRGERRLITEEFTKNRDVQILLATDAAGEGLNLQAAHLMVNYDLPWNPNRIEQRFGRIHRIGQEEVCRLWNLVASNTREGEVFTRLLEKLEQMRQTYGGKVFDVLGEAFTETPLRNLLLDAIQYGERPDVKAKMHQVIDASVGDGLKDLLDERALASENLAEADLQALRAAMDEARARRLQPHYIELAFKAAFSRLGGRIAKREQGRYEIANVPQQIRASGKGPIATKYDRVTFELGKVHAEELTRADLLAPGHPLHDAVMDEAVRQFGGTLNRGTVLVSSTLEEPHLLVGVVEEVADATGGSVSRRFGYAYVDSFGTVTPAGPAPYLDCVAAPNSPVTDAARALPWLADAEDKATSWIIANQLPEYLAEVQPRRLAELSKARDLVTKRLEGERDRLLLDAAIASEKERAGDKPKETSESLNRKAVELDVRLRKRLELLDQQQLMSTKPPRIVTAALVLPVGMLEADLPLTAPMHAKETKEVERRGVDLVLARERELGRKPVEQAFNNPGFDILSTDANGDTYRIEVKARIDGATDFFVTHNEVMTGKNAVPRYRLALVRVDPRGARARRGPLPRRPVRHHRPRRLRRHRHPRRLGEAMDQGEAPVLMAGRELPGWAAELGEVATGHGAVRLVRVTRELPLMASTAFVYAAVVVEPEASYGGPIVAMLVTIHDPDAHPAQTADILETIDQTPPGRWRGEERQVDNVYAAPEFRGGYSLGISAPVAVGRFLLESGRLTLHSATRSPHGDRWARDVGGKVPELLGGLTGDFKQHMRDWLDALNADVGESDVT